MKNILSIFAILCIAELSHAAPDGSEAAKPMICSKFSPINVTAAELAGEWYVAGYGFDGTNDQPHLKCQRRKFIVNADGLTGILETSNIDPATEKMRTFSAPFFVAKPGVLVIGLEPQNERTRTLTVLYLKNNILAYHLLTSNCGKGDSINEPRIAVREKANVKDSDLEPIMKELPTFADYKEFREIPHTNCQH